MPLYIGVLFAGFGRTIDGPGLPGGFSSSTRDIHLVALKGRLGTMPLQTSTRDP